MNFKFNKDLIIDRFNNFISKYSHIVKKHKKLYAILKYIAFVFKPRRKSSVTMTIGDCGAGKTSYAVRVAQKYIKKGYPVYSNMFIRGAYKLSVSDLMVYDLEPNALIVIDEAASYGLASRGNNYKQSNTPEIIEFFTMYRHYLVREVIVLCPSFSDIIPIVRDRTDRILLVTKSILNVFGIGKYKVITKHTDIINDDTPKEVFSFVPLFRGFYFQYSTFMMYDSFSRKELKQKTWLKW